MTMKYLQHHFQASSRHHDVKEHIPSLVSRYQVKALTGRTPRIRRTLNNGEFE